jgi:hypothetical protein
MDGGGAGAEAMCDAARADMVAHRRTHYRLLERVAALDEAGTGDRVGLRDTVRLIQEIWHLDRADAVCLRDTAADLVPRVALSGQPLPARLPATGAAAAEGLLGERQIRIVRTTMRRIAAIDWMEPDAEAQAEDLLARWAAELPPKALQKAANRLIATLDPDGAAPEDEDGGTDDELHVGRRRDGSLALKGRIHDLADVETVLEVLGALSTPAGPDDRRTLGQRQAEAFKELVTQALAPTGIAAEPSPIPAPREHTHDDLADSAKTRATGRALLMITMDHRWLQRQVGHATLDSDTAISPATARRWACDAGVVPAVLGSRSEPLDLGRLSYTVSDAQRRALHLRDGGCAFPGCTRRPKRCAAHHIRHWCDGGPTDLENLTLLCQFHHTVIHHGGWTIEMRHGRPWFTPPAWADPDRTPRPGGRHLVAG